jgi:DNA-binding MurR/RpiR family transcriptional regulator
MILEKLNLILNSTDLPDPAHAIAHTLIKTLHNDEDFTIQQVADQSGVSKSMVSKFAKKIGYEGFKDLKESILEYRIFKSEKKSGAKLSMKEYLASLQSHLNVYLDENFRTQLWQLAFWMAQSHCIYLYGVDYDFMYCNQLQIKLLESGQASVLLDDHIQRNYQIKENSMLLIFDSNQIFSTFERTLKPYFPLFEHCVLLGNTTDNTNLTSLPLPDGFFEEDIYMHILVDVLGQMHFTHRLEQ